MHVLSRVGATALAFFALTTAAFAQTVDFTPVADYLLSIVGMVVAAAFAAGIEMVRRWIGLERKHRAIEALKVIADSAMEAGEASLRSYAGSLTVNVGNPQVAAIAGYIVHQGPDLMREAGMSEEQVAAWVTRMFATKDAEPETA